MSARDRNRSESSSNIVTLGPRDSLVGTLTIEGDLNVQGTVEGAITVTGDVTVDATATVQASIEGRNVTIRGQVDGNVVSSKRLQLSGSGTLNGDAQVGRLVVEDGASFNGAITMGARPAATETTDATDTGEGDTEWTESQSVEMVGASEGFHSN